MSQTEDKKPVPEQTEANQGSQPSEEPKVSSETAPNKE